MNPNDLLVQDLPSVELLLICIAFPVLLWICSRFFSVPPMPLEVLKYINETDASLKEYIQWQQETIEKIKTNTEILRDSLRLVEEIQQLRRQGQNK